jgi:protein-L-isoaspartate(D-aspartate) O-methyltransferase
MPLPDPLGRGSEDGWVDFFGRLAEYESMRRFGARGIAGLAAFGLGLPFFAGQEAESVFTALRKEMVRTQLRERDISDRRVLAVMEEVPRHLFVPPPYRPQAYEDYPLPIEEGQTISQPYIVALMSQTLKLRGEERVLEIGTGSGYQAAVLSRLAGRVYTIEYHEALARSAADRLRSLGYANVEVRAGDGFFGWPEKAPFEAIMVTCAARSIPRPLVDQLSEGGRLILPLEDADEVQRLTLVTKVKGRPRIEPLTYVRFVPMLGEVRRKK